ncbi:phosphatase PAP2 family protein [Croceitalea rosinachiae]|uniref:Phosphatase PAP2 family protein n=1 Tax=Croceitalea rosinachiae TaxID=3075596 RepID=A0ABU3AEH8_9FLAO|nr:phosphatase PAP2 family protein [Croceitalea sp. F388]MDT0608591.1 phosphatase PAP2 family protein [Croceitalea sp. F388]
MQIIKNRLLPFFVAFFLLMPFLFISKLDLMVVVNTSRTPFFDVFFAKSSALGNAITVAFVIFLVLLFRLKWLAVFLLGFITQVVIVLLLKKGLFAGELRPYLFFRMNGLLDSVVMIEGLKMRYVNTFPSGHTATIFFLVSFFALLARNRVASWVLLCVGLTVGFSRIYLFQHWYADVYFGMLFGTFSSIIAYLVVKKYPKQWHTKQIRIDFRGAIKETQNALRQLF